MISTYFNYFFSKLIVFLLWASGFVCTFYSHSSRDKVSLFIWDCFVCLSSVGRPILLYTSLLELLLFCLIGFGALCFHFQLYWGCFLDFIFDFFKEPFVVSSMLFRSQVYGFSSFLWYVCIAMNFPLSTAFTVLHRFWVVVFSFSLVSMHILISFLFLEVCLYCYELSP